MAAVIDDVQQDAAPEVALAAVEDGDGVEGVQLYVCGLNGELELLALETKEGGRRWALRAPAADVVEGNPPSGERYPEDACRLAREAADGCARGDRLTASLEGGALRISIKRKIGGKRGRLARVLAATLEPVRGAEAAAAERRCRARGGAALRAADATIAELEKCAAALEAARATLEETLERHVAAVRAADLAPDFARILATRAPATVVPAAPPHNGESSSSEEDDDSDAACPDTPERASPVSRKAGVVPGTNIGVVAFEGGTMDFDILDDICGPVKSEPRVKKEVKKEVKREVKREVKPKGRKRDVLDSSDDDTAPDAAPKRAVKPEAPPPKKKRKDILDSDSEEFD